MQILLRELVTLTCRTSSWVKMFSGRTTVWKSWRSIVLNLIFSRISPKVSLRFSGLFSIFFFWHSCLAHSMQKRNRSNSEHLISSLSHRIRSTSWGHLYKPAASFNSAEVFWPKNSWTNRMYAFKPNLADSLACATKFCWVIFPCRNLEQFSWRQSSWNSPAANSRSNTLESVRLVSLVYKYLKRIHQAWSVLNH